MPSRADTAPRAIASILAQVERLWLFLDRFDVIPAYAEHERIRRPANGRKWGTSARTASSLGLACERRAHCTFFSLDDDVEYPA